MHMKTFHHITLREFVKEYEGEDLEQQKEFLLSLIPLQNVKKEDWPKIKVEKNLRHDNFTPIYVLELRLEKQALIEKFLSQVFENLGEEQMADWRKYLYVDEESMCFLRLEKPALQQGKYILTTSGDCVHIRMLIAAYPANAKNAKKIISAYLDAKQESAVKKE